MTSQNDMEKLIDMLSRAGIHPRPDDYSTVKHRYWVDQGPEKPDRVEEGQEAALFTIDVYDDAWSDFFVLFRFRADGSLLSVGARE